LLEGIGLEPQRLQMINISSAMAGEFSSTTSEFTETIREMGANPLRGTLSLSEKAPLDAEEME
jgi:coenzyme F420-reducing hydrogenase delta subunit